MKKVITIITILTVTFSFSQVEKAEVIYRIKHFKPQVNTKLNTDQSRVNKRAEIVMKETENIEMKLLFNQNTSSFASEQMDVDDSKNHIRKIAEILVGAKSKYFSFLNEKKIVREHEFDGKMYNIFSHYSDLKWQLIDETKTIGKYKCYKAILNKEVSKRDGKTTTKIIAWYAPSLPIPLGPKNYLGLPGLILEVQERGSIFYASKISINPSKKIKVLVPKKGKMLSESEYSKITTKAKSVLLK